MYNRQQDQYTAAQWQQMQQQQWQKMQQMNQTGQYPNPYQPSPPAGYVKRPGCGCGRKSNNR